MQSMLVRAVACSVVLGAFFVSPKLVQAALPPDTPHPRLQVRVENEACLNAVEHYAVFNSVPLTEAYRLAIQKTMVAGGPQVVQVSVSLTVHALRQQLHYGTAHAEAEAALLQRLVKACVYFRK
jgi:hypothetical protein